MFLVKLYSKTPDLPNLYSAIEKSDTTSLIPFKLIMFQQTLKVKDFQFAAVENYKTEDEALKQTAHRNVFLHS